MNLCGKCVDKLVGENKIPPLENKNTWVQVFCGGCHKPSVCFYCPDAKIDMFR